ncbi:MAG: PHP domain-containing protein [Deltaproteobacteria bacterium]|nr:PHP domain-containing protein [Deltaproteobacteria bacterium]
MDYNNLIDLHIHTTASDGTLSPEQVLKSAEKLNLKAISITDHDTLEGCRQAVKAGIPKAVKFITGIEISAEFPEKLKNKNGLHILGYNIKLDDAQFEKELIPLKKAREDRNIKMIERLAGLGIKISLQDLNAQAKTGLCGRPHFAAVMLQKKHVRSLNEAFDRYIGVKGKAYIPKYKISCKKVIQSIKNAGGIPVLAHPIFLNMHSENLKSFISYLKSVGLEGIEVFYPEHKAADTAYYIKLAEEFGLKKTGGTDYHGKNKPEINMGTGRGKGFYIPYNIYEELIA